MEQREKIGSVLLRPASKPPVSVEVFPAEQWLEGRPGLYRLRVDGAWGCNLNCRRAIPFCNLEGVGALLANRFMELAGVQALASEENGPYRAAAWSGWRSTRSKAARPALQPS